MLYINVYITYIKYRKINLYDTLCNINNFIYTCMHVSDPCIALTMCQVLFLELYKYFNSLIFTIALVVG